MLQSLRRKAEERNPDEFYFGMEKAQTRDGVHVQRSTEANKYTQVRSTVGHGAGPGYLLVVAGSATAD